MLNGHVGAANVLGLLSGIGLVGLGIVLISNARQFEEASASIQRGLLGSRSKRLDAQPRRWVTVAVATCFMLAGFFLVAAGLFLELHSER